jgi:hypothetical protein
MPVLNTTSLPESMSELSDANATTATKASAATDALSNYQSNPTPQQKAALCAALTELLQAAQASRDELEALIGAIGDTMAFYGCSI